MKAIIPLLLFVFSTAICCTEKEKKESDPICGTTEFLGVLDSIEARLYKGDSSSEISYGMGNTVVYNPKTNWAMLTINDTNDILTYAAICNFPEYVNEWTISEGGIDIIMSGKKYKSSLPSYTDTHEHVNVDFVITNLMQK